MIFTLLTILALGQVAQYEPDFPGTNTYKGVEVMIDLPDGLIADGGQRVRNFGAPRDGLGLCVFASMDMNARYLNATPLIDIIHKLPTGGGWPEKVDKVVSEHAPGIQIAQYEGADPAILDLAMKTGRPICVTYGYGKLYSYKTIAHMVLLVHLDRDFAAIIDNNDPLHVTWMSRNEFLKRWVHPRNQGWAYVLIFPPPPPTPRNLTKKTVQSHTPIYPSGPLIDDRRRKAA